MLDAEAYVFDRLEIIEREQIEHWERGVLVRKLDYSGDGGGWITQTGTPQAWEATYFFADDEGTAEGATWPLNLGDELSDEEIARYERARVAKDATGIMDLLSGGSMWPLHRVFAHFGLDPAQVGARYTPPTNWKPRILIAAVLVLFVGAALAGALTSW